MANENFAPIYSTDNIWRGTEADICLTDELDAMDADIEALQTNKANTNHTHTEYAGLVHDHTNYAEVDHEHFEYATTSEVEALEILIGDTAVADQIATAIVAKADSDHAHTEYAPANHQHENYANTTHEHDGYAPESHIHAQYAEVGHDHDYAAIDHSHNYNELVGAPTTFPANGGNADTVGGKAASEFATATSVAALQGLIGDTPVSTQISEAIEDKADEDHIHALADVTGLTSELGAKYEKPSTGIPKTDLASAVQTSLGKADTAIQSLAGYATEFYVDAKVAAVVDSSPEALNTLNELAAALGDDPNFATTVATQIGTKVDKVEGKGLSTNDYTTIEKTKLAGIAEGANKTIVDTALSSTSTNPVQNKVVNTAISNLISLVGDTAVSTQISSAVANKVDAVSGKGLSTNDYTTAEKTKLSGIATGAEVNQNSFSNIKIGSTTISADSKTDTLSFVAGSNITLTPDATNDQITIAATNTTYSAATTSVAGLMSASDKVKLDGIATGANKITVDSALSSSSTNPVQNNVINTALAGKADSGHTHSAATTSVAGLMSAADKAKLDGIATSANNYSLPAAGSSLGGVKSGGDVTISSGVITVNDDSHAHVISNVDGLQSALDGKAASSHNHGAGNITSGTLSSDRLPTVPIAKGGTGATTVAGALTNLGNIGKVYSTTPSAKSIAKNTLASIATLTLPVGTYIMTANHQWSVDGGSSMCLDRLTKSDDSVVYAIGRGTMVGGGGMCLSAVIDLTAQTTIKYEAYHAYSSAASAEAIKFYAVKIK